MKIELEYVMLIDNIPLHRHKISSRVEKPARNIDTTPPVEISGIFACERRWSWPKSEPTVLHSVRQSPSSKINKESTSTETYQQQTFQPHKSCNYNQQNVNWKLNLNNHF